MDKIACTVFIVVAKSRNNDKDGQPQLINRSKEEIFINNIRNFNLSNMKAHQQA